MNKHRAKSTHRKTPRLTLGFALVASLASCGGGGETDGPPGAVRTLVYAPTVCREDAAQRTVHQELHILRGEDTPVVVTDAAETYTQESPLVFAGACRLAGLGGGGGASLFGGLVQRLGVSPDGSTVVFEKTNRFSVIGLPPLTAEREGFFVVRSDGSGLRRLGPASRASITRLVLDPSGPLGLRTFSDSSLIFSADGRMVVFTDRGPGPDDEDATQIVTLDLITGVRTQLTHLPACPPCDEVFAETGGARFLSDGRIVFFTLTNPDGLNPNNWYRVATVNLDGTGFELVPLPFAEPGSIVNQSFAITGDRPTSFDFGEPCKEIFVLDHENLLQVTHFCRRDTHAGTQSADGLRVFFVASADPFGTNPCENIQIFSVDRLGGDLRQLTGFSQGGPTSFGCNTCGVGFPRQDPLTGTLVFDSNCDPFGMNPNGGQIFAIDPDGNNLRQLTDTRGFTTEDDGTVHVEMTGPFASTAERQ